MISDTFLLYNLLKYKMKIAVLYDSLYGNTKILAEIISNAIKSKSFSVEEFDAKNLGKYDILFIGSPTHGGRPKKEMKRFLKKIPKNSLKNTKIAVFDTRASLNELNPFLKKLINFFGYAAPRIEKELKKKGAESIINTEGFFVEETKGPLIKGEEKRAEEWSNTVIKKGEKNE